MSKKKTLKKNDVGKHFVLRDPEMASMAVVTDLMNRISDQLVWMDDDQRNRVMSYLKDRFHFNGIDAFK